MSADPVRCWFGSNVLPGGQAVGGEDDHHNTFIDGVVNGHLIMARDVGHVHMPPPPLVQPRQMVSRPEQFVGRDRELRDLRQLLAPRAGSGSRVGVVVGLPGVGKTALVAEATYAALEQGWFDGGHLLLNLRGYDRVPLSAHDALGQLLRDLGVATEKIPGEEQARAARFRSELAQRKEPLLIVLDNVSSESQVKPLLPGEGPHRVLVTSRDSLPDLIAPVVSLDTLSQEESVEYMRRVLQARFAHDTRIQDQHADAAEVVRLCGCLPLALRIAAATLASVTTKPLAKLAEELAAHGARLGVLNAVRAAFDLSYQRLATEDAGAARLLRLLGLNGSPGISLAAAAAVAGLPEKTACLQLDRLTAARLLDQGADSSRWTMHDLLWEYAKLAVTDEPERSREKARSRLLGYYNQTCEKAASSWLDAECVNLVAAAEAAAEYGQDTVALELADRLSSFLRMQYRWAEKITTDRACLVVARRRRDRLGEADALAALGDSFHQLSRFAEARDHYQQALAIDRPRRKTTWFRLPRNLIPHGARHDLGSDS